MLENVPGITQLCFQDSAVGVASQTTLFGDPADEIADYDTIIGRVDRDLREAGYEVVYLSIPAVALGAPHLRQRIFIVGHLANPNGNGNGQLGKSGNGHRIRSADSQEPESRVEHPEQLDQYAPLYIANSIDNGCEGRHKETGREVGSSQQGRVQQPAGENSDVANTQCQRLERLNQQCCPPQFWGDEGISASGYADSTNVALSKSRKSRKQTEQKGRESASGTDNYARNTEGIGATAEREVPGERERDSAIPNTQRNNGSDKWGIPNWDEHWYSVATRLCTQTPAGVLPVDDGVSRELARPKGWRINALKATGNAVVPQICLEIFRCILSAEIDYVSDP